MNASNSQWQSVAKIALRFTCAAQLNTVNLLSSLLTTTSDKYFFALRKRPRHDNPVRPLIMVIQRSRSDARMSAGSKPGHVGFSPIASEFRDAAEFRDVPVAAIEDDGTILYSILTCSLSNAFAKVYPG